MLIKLYAAMLMAVYHPRVIALWLGAMRQHCSLHLWFCGNVAVYCQRATHTGCVCTAEAKHNTWQGEVEVLCVQVVGRGMH